MELRTWCYGVCTTVSVIVRVLTCGIDTCRITGNTEARMGGRGGRGEGKGGEEEKGKNSGRGKKIEQKKRGNRRKEIREEKREREGRRKKDRKKGVKVGEEEI